MRISERRFRKRSSPTRKKYPRERFLPPELINTIDGLRSRLRGAPSIGFVPTMGALHRGHAKLLETARQESGLVVASIFVNPLQFDRTADLECYPRTLQADLEVCAATGVDIVFAPHPAELYPSEQFIFVDAPALSETLCGANRPGHFRGMATVVLKLLNVVQPHRSYFGQKDAQQLAIIRRMAHDFNLPGAIVAVPTVREPDGLALSSRNVHLSTAERNIAPVLSQALRAAAALLDAGESSVSTIRRHVDEMFRQFPAVRVEYFEVVDPETLRLVPEVSGPVLIAGAIWLGTTRLIDNITWPELHG